MVRISIKEDRSNIKTDSLAYKRRQKTVKQFHVLEYLPYMFIDRTTFFSRFKSDYVTDWVVLKCYIQYPYTYIVGKYIIYLHEL